jgi:DNA-binding NarL/FixJ family response regulator
MRVLIAEDSVLLRAGLERLLAEGDFEVVGAVGDGPALVAAAAALRPEIAIVDVRMPPTHTDEGLRAALEVRRLVPESAILVLSQYVEERYALELIGSIAEGVGYLLKDRVADVAEFLDAVRRVAAGGTALDPEVVAQLLGRRRRGNPLEALSPREREVLALMAEGRSNAAIAAELVVTDGAVEKHVSNIFAKLGLPTTANDHRRVLAVLTTFASERAQPASASDESRRGGAPGEPNSSRNLAARPRNTTAMVKLLAWHHCLRRSCSSTGSRTGTVCQGPAVSSASVSRRAIRCAPGAGIAVCGNGNPGATGTGGGSSRALSSSLMTLSCSSGDSERNALSSNAVSSPDIVIPPRDTARYQRACAKRLALSRTATRFPGRR